MKTLQIKLGDNLHRLFKAKCAGKETTMQKKIMDLIDLFVKGKIKEEGDDTQKGG